MIENEFSKSRTCQCYCQNCGQNNPKQFFASQSGLYPSGYLPLCKQCMKKLYDVYLQKYKTPQKAMQRICMAFDIYYSDAILRSCDTSNNKFIGKYLRSFNQNQYKGKTFDSNIDEGFHFSSNFGINEVDDDGTAKIDPDLIKRWGAGLDVVDYDTLENHYNYLKSANPRSDNNNQEIFINNLCYTQMQLMKAVRQGRVDDYSKLTESYRKTFTQAGLKTVASASEMDAPIAGVTIETIERYTPAEYYKNKKLFKDFDGLGDYISRFLTRPLRNLQFGTNDRDCEYYVKSEEEYAGGDADE